MQNIPQTQKIGGKYMRQNLNFTSADNKDIELLMNRVNETNRNKMIDDALCKMNASCMRPTATSKKFDRQSFIIGAGIIIGSAILVIWVLLSSLTSHNTYTKADYNTIPMSKVASEITYDDDKQSSLINDYEIMKVEEVDDSDINDVNLIEYQLPSYYYGSSLDFSSVQPYMDYGTVTNKGTPAYKVCYSNMAYTDNDGMRRIAIVDGFKVNGQDDYVIALGTYYNGSAMTAGSRWLIETSTGRYTATVGDVKNDLHTDKFNMFGIHGEDSEIAGMIEFIVDCDKLDPKVKKVGSITAGNNYIFAGEILHIYKIEESISA